MSFRNKPIKKTIAIVLYITVLYYLLPFRPCYLYSIVHQKPNHSYHCFKNEHVSSAHETFLKIGDPFPKKNKSKFGLEGNIIIAPIFNGFVFTYRKVVFPFVQPKYVAPLILCNSNRGPPLV